MWSWIPYLSIYEISNSVKKPDCFEGENDVTEISCCHRFKKKSRSSTYEISFCQVLNSLNGVNLNSLFIFCCNETAVNTKTKISERTKKTKKSLTSRSTRWHHRHLSCYLVDGWVFCGITPLRPPSAMLWYAAREAILHLKVNRRSPTRPCTSSCRGQFCTCVAKTGLFRGGEVE